MKILVTGSSGHLGEALMRVLKEERKEVLGIDILSSPYTDQVGSIADKNFVRKNMPGITHVLHTATLHKPHVATHEQQKFIDTNITGTLNLLEASVENNIRSFIFTSTTSTFGDALTPGPETPAAWITEDVVPIPKNIYGVTKTAAEDLCRLFHRNHQLPCLILKTSRFFPEEDDDSRIAANYADDNVKANEYLYRRVDTEDVVSAHLLAMEKAPLIGFSKYIISATTPFEKNHLWALRKNAHEVVKSLYPGFEKIYAGLGWQMFPGIGRVYVNKKAREELGWFPKYDFGYILDKLKAGAGFKSELAGVIGSKGYHRS
ncbi:MAG TPA: NAD(P)-dependent oxidoreductase [Puia sp.]|nr:NAD(P)-dependent oxidoreductase [Puia sp.]